MKISLFAAAACVAIAFASSAHADTVTLSASKDTSIFQNNANNSDGAGQGLFAGTNGQSSPRRALIAFNVGGIPSNAIVQSVQLTLKVGQVAGSGGGGGVAVRLGR